MKQILLTFRLRGKRDVVRARQRARQIAGLLGYDARDKACLAAAVFSLACQARQHYRHVVLYFQVEENVLRVFPLGQNREGLGIEMRLPGSLPFSGQDLAWMAQQLDHWTPPGLFEELQKLNQELIDSLEAPFGKVASTIRVRRDTAA